MIPKSSTKMKGVFKMKKKVNQVVNDEEMTLRANLNNIEPGDSVNEHRSKETANLIIASDDIKQQNNNL